MGQFLLRAKELLISLGYKEMAFRFPPPTAGPPTAPAIEQTTPPFTPVMNFNIPPPGFRPSYINKTHNQETYFNCPPLQPQASEDFSRNTVELLRESELPAEETPNITKCLQDLIQRKDYHVNLPKRHKTPSLKICEARRLLQLCLNDLKKLQTLQEDLNSSYQDLSPTLWKEKWDHIKHLKIEVHNSLGRLNKPETLGTLRKLLMKQSKKRKREKRKHAERQEMLADCRVKRQHLDKSIDNWLKDMQDVVERAKREESLKHEADQVLSEVTRKKTEARRQLNMLKALEKLRHIRAQTAIRSGQHVNAEAGNRFTRVTEHLLNLWEDQMKEYEIEEQGLRVMLEEAVEERTKSEVSQLKQVLNQWDVLLFGKRKPFNNFYQAAEKDIEAFIEIRKSWDKFIAHPGAVVSSSIPVGWVLPANPSSEKWGTLLMKDTMDAFATKQK